jgi:hypothetical protein
MRSGGEDCPKIPFQEYLYTGIKLFFRRCGQNLQPISHIPAAMLTLCFANTMSSWSKDIVSGEISLDQKHV